ncbi:MAG: DUF350 domain-containing protein [candidate division KSB1 bacterium]|nr:DUF350 domain-containing protein [candidate division KSB1 bacterium]
MDKKIDGRKFFGDFMPDTSLLMKLKRNDTLIVLWLVILLLIGIVALKWTDQLQILIKNFIYALLGVLIAIQVMLYAYQKLDGLTNFNTSSQLKNGNIAVGLMVCGLWIGVAILIGLIFGYALN